MKKTTISALCISAVIAPATIADVKDDKDVQAAITLADAWVENRLAYDNVPGGSVAVVYDQEVVWSKGFGYARLKGKVKATADTKYSICSVSKLFTSIGVMQLRDQGKLSLDAPIADTLPWYDLPANEQAEEPVTLRNILSHVSGLPREAVTPYWSTVEFPTREQIRTGLKTQQTYYRPYENFQYSNLGLTLAGEAVAAASGTDYHDYVKTHILDPLDMQDTTSDLPVDEYGKSFAAGYRLKNAKGKRKEFAPYTTNGIAPAAGFASSANDLAKFASWQFRLHRDGGEEILKSTTLREMQRVHWTTPDTPGAVWGLGFAMSKVDGKTFVGHGGYCPGYRTSFLTRPSDKLAVIAMVNVNDFSPSTLTQGIAGIIAPALSTAGATKDTVDDDGPDLAKYAGYYSHDVWPFTQVFAVTSTGLASLNISSEAPANGVQKLKHIEGHTFKALSRSNKELYDVKFEVDEDGNVTRVWTHGQYANRLK